MTFNEFSFCECSRKVVLTPVDALERLPIFRHAGGLVSKKPSTRPKCVFSKSKIDQSTF